MFTFSTGASHTLVHRGRYGEGTLSDLSLVRIKLLADELQRGGGELLDAPCSLALRYPSSLEAEFLQRSISHQKNKSINCVIIIMFSITMLIAMQ